MSVRISIVTPVLNGAQFLTACIDNVASQDCAAVEHLIVDGGSSDGTVELLRRASDKHPHLRWISEPDGGQSDAINKGTSLARGSVVGLLNVDDFYEPDVLNRALQTLGEMPSPALVVGNCRVLGPDGRSRYLNRPRHLSLRHFLAGFTVPVNPAAYFYHVELHRQLGGYDVGDHYTMDYDFLFRAVKVARVRHVDELWGNFRMRPSAKTYEDVLSGRQAARLSTLHARFLSAFPPGQRLLIRFARAAYIPWRRLANAIRHPNLLREAVQKRA
jgi:glycosyltransferase involved in cell wall biosynthesis